MKKMNNIVLISAASILGFTACKGPAQKGVPAMPPTPVNITEASVAPAVYYDKYPATVVALNQVELRSQVSGFITGIFFKEGEVVQKGKTLYEIDRRKYEAAYLQAQANVASARASFDRAKKDDDRYQRLADQDAVARQILDNAKATLETSRSQLAAAEANLAAVRTDLDYSLIKAPFTGRIGISQVKLGAQVSPGTTLLNTISSENPIGVDFVVTENDISRFAAMQGGKASDSTFRLQLSDGTEFVHAGKILAIDRGVDNQTGTIRVRIEFNNPDDRLKDGMSCVLRVLNEQSGERLIIPYKAITEQMGEYFVFIAKDSVAAQQKVHLGPKIGDRIVIMDGVQAGDKVITEGFQRLRDGGKIQIGIPAAPTGAPAKK
ncbi:membrane fusion protein, multidrug efflux system [Chitinophaga ginsengisegetis]|uniref:Membrane fusion protein, multidrug efflux system n=2 Tax=Chitinophagaceae TaxID=563835 RepID=A0A1T5NIA1_9BACT|nr:efflux RND transporter periplasmic adaptor subunit [Chitinophaga ginsengisegetis]MDR6569695.1 membrane fusion protein (multidrug efflux system) [Chitinophaga ginsengisegetis]MDR6649428.1 membrane fusion protein (multidrug efflux system) [Chitinophaga ginsengisegetis]MDR6655778.1 membrane fusion protein (multidrug efflux system) [Chitinophaga ginsengisegetis]SKD00171.1 membrane fusion protein, multidrug efflux system [Chitinophaga ginsengisegetis]